MSYCVQRAKLIFNCVAGECGEPLLWDLRGYWLGERVLGNRAEDVGTGGWAWVLPQEMEVRDKGMIFYSYPLSANLCSLSLFGSASVSASVSLPPHPLLIHTGFCNTSNAGLNLSIL